MTILVRNVLVADPQSAHHNRITDIFIENGIIKSIGNNLSMPADTVVEAPQLSVSPGWIDLFAHFNDPGNEQRETLESGALAAAAGGFTRVCLLPNTNPVTDAKAQVEYMVQKSRDLPVHICPLGAISKKTEGKELAEMYDMRSSGAVAFTDGINPVQSPGLLLKALQYIKAFNGTIIQVPNDKSISAHGLMNEGITSTRLGLPGIPSIAEELLIKRDIDLVKYTGSSIHFTGVSTARGIELIIAARAEGLKVSCSVTPYHLVFSEEDLVQYDTNLKVSPPLRSKQDVAALQQAVRNGDVDCIATHHLPHHSDNKICEFEYAKEGMIGLETAFGLVNTAVKDLSAAQITALFSTGAAKVLGMETTSIAEGAIAELTLFSQPTTYTVQPGDIRSRSANTPVIGMELSGKVIGVINKGKVFLN